MTNSGEIVPAALGRKAELLDALIRAEKKKAELLEQFNEKTELVKEAEKRQKEADKAYQMMQEALRIANENLRTETLARKIISANGKELEDDISRMRRELSRMEDNERINAEYMSQVASFRDKCLDAMWRKENRTDGMGAMPHQIEGAIAAAVPRQVLLGDKRGLGKSLTSLIWADLLEAKRVIIVTPSETMDNFVREIKMWTPHRSVIKIGKMSKIQRDFVLPNLKNLAEVTIVVNYEAWRRDRQLIEDLIALQCDTLIYDEAHIAKEIGSLAYQGLHDIRFGLNVCPTDCGIPMMHPYKENPSASKAEVRDMYHCLCGHIDFITEFCSIKNVMPMTGTPILNRPQELYPHLRLIDPKNFWDLNIFLRDFCRQTGSRSWTWQYGGEKKLIERIGARMIARDRKAAGVIIPPASIQIHSISMEEMQENYPAQYRAYRQARDYAQLALSPEMAISMAYQIVVLLRLRQVLTWPAGIKLEVKDPKSGATVHSSNLDVHESVKADKVEALIRQLWEEEERVVVFSQFKPILEELQRRLGSKSVVYDGDTSEYVRGQIQLDFDAKTVSSDPRWNAVLCNYKAAGVGLNFTAASQMVIIDREWNPGKEDQAMGRTDRIGQTRDTTVHMFQVENSVDTWLDGLIEEKKDLIAGFEGEAKVYQSAYDALRNGEM